MTIPRIVMQTWKTENVPQHWKTSPKSIKTFLPHWKYVLLTDADNIEFVNTYFPNLLTWFSSLTYPIQRADVVRYMWLYIHGGLYMDLDIELVGNIDELFKGGSRATETWLLKAPRNFAGHFTNFLMASTPRNPFWLLVLDECKKPLESWVILPHHVISQQTGLAALTRATKLWDKPITLLPQNFLIPCDYCSPKYCSKPFSYTKFLKGKSWNGIDTHIMNFVGCNPEIFILFFLGMYMYCVVRLCNLKKKLLLHYDVV